MTAEIAIINKTAIALAADSKVTLTNNGRQKTYDTVDKLFSLSKTEPVGAMIYGNAEFMGFPWETVLKDYRRKNPTKTFDTVFDWADDLHRHLLTFFPFTEDDEADVIRRLALTAIGQLWQNFAANADGSETPEQVSNILAQELDLHIEALNAIDNFFNDDEWATIVEKHAGQFEKICASNSAKLMPADKVRQFSELIVRKKQSSTNHSGLVVAGFGEKELLPSLVSFEVDGIIGGKLKLVERDRFDTTRKNRGVVIPFAQTDMVYRFMEGIDPVYVEQLHQDVAQLVLQTAVDTASALGKTAKEIEALMPAFHTATDAAIQAFVGEGVKFRREQFASPIIDMAMSLPKDELANLAESLVSLTSLQRRVSREIETVGGPIDVAVISKGDGFVWIKRKHYFKPDRNLRFVSSYFSEYGQPANPGDDE